MLRREGDGGQGQPSRGGEERRGEGRGGEGGSWLGAALEEEGSGVGCQLLLLHDPF
jgi:hypothetical protein